MALIARNERLTPDIWRMTVSGSFAGAPGQFYMLRPSDTLDPLLSRPISIHAITPDEIVFVYRTVGRGTHLLSDLREGDTITLFGPYGHGFSPVDRDMTIIGGGIGIAPMYLLAKEQKRLYPKRRLSVYLGYTKDVFLEDEFRALADVFVKNVGGYITDEVDFANGDIFCACGPEPMLRAAYGKASPSGAELLVSLEKRMACGIGACLGCSIATRSGNRRVCKDGPVFPAEEVFGLA